MKTFNFSAATSIGCTLTEEPVENELKRSAVFDYASQRGRRLSGGTPLRSSWISAVSAGCTMSLSKGVPGFGTNRISLLMVLMAVWMSIGSVRGLASAIEFDSNSYNLVAGESAFVEIHLDAPAAAGLFSYGVTLTYDSSDPFEFRGAVSPAPLDFFGVLGPGNFVEQGIGSVGIKGTVDALTFPTSYYGGTLLSTVELSFPSPGTYQVGLDLFQTLGPSEDVFVTGDFSVLDESLSFGTATFHVIGGNAVPESGGGLLFVAGILALLCLQVRALRRGE